MRFRDCVDVGRGLELYASERASEAKIRLDLTMNPLGYPDRIRDYLKDIPVPDIGGYPDEPELPQLISSIAEKNGLETDEIILTAAADQGIEIALTHLLDPGQKLGIMSPTFPRFEIVAKKLCDARVEPFARLDGLPQDCRVVFLCNPNNPTTEELDFGELESAIQSNPDVDFLIDAVFSDFGHSGFSPLVKQYGNVANIKSFSKSFGLAGLRVGWIESQKGNIAAFREGISPFRVPMMSQRIALEALKCPEHVDRTIDYLGKEYEKIKQELGDRVVRGSHVPFYLFMTDEPKLACERLLREGISVVGSHSFSGVKRGFLRIAIGKEEENGIVVAALKRLRA